MVRDFLRKFGLLFSSKVKDDSSKTYRDLKEEEEALNAKLDALEEMEQKIKKVKN
ncbi:MAG: hypothetical protein KTR22_12345 [Flavobacteriaceae bacterium]|nr:hypothetical protein [Flavobacteriaceae bacterium]